MRHIINTLLIKNNPLANLLQKFNHQLYKFGDLSSMVKTGECFRKLHTRKQVWTETKCGGGGGTRL